MENKIENQEELIFSEQDRERFEGEAISAEKEINEKVNKAIKSNVASRRWFWELLQNAIDTIADNEKIIATLIIEDTEDGVVIRFRHNGGPFKKARQKYRFDDFKNLINPTSGKSQEDTTTIGKFGTGFLSTHIVSLKIDVQGIFENTPDDMFSIKTSLNRKDFLLETDEARNKRIESIIQSLIEYEKSKVEKPSINNSTPVAEFTYYLNESKFDNEETVKKIIEDGLKEIDHSLPFVFVFTPKIEKVIIEDKRIGKRISYSSRSDEFENGKFKIRNTEVFENSVLKDTISVAYMKNDKCTVAWEINSYSNTNSELKFKNCRGRYKEELNHEMSSLFSTFPLIGSHDLKFPLVVHSSGFKPNESRDGIDLNETDINNKGIIESAINLYKEYLKESAINYHGLYYICDIVKTIKPDHEWIEYKWFNEYQAELKKIILTAKIIDTSESELTRKSITDEYYNPQLYFPDLKVNREITDDERKIVKSRFFKFSQRILNGFIPTENSLEYWKKFLWTETEKIRRIDEKFLIDKIAESSDLNGFESYFINDYEEQEKRKVEAVSWLSNFYNFIVDDLGNIDLLNYSGKSPKKGIILSRSNKFKLFQELKKDSGHNGAIINDSLLSLFKLFYSQREDYSDILLKNDFAKLVSLKNEQITEESVAEEIIKEANELIKKHDEILKRISNKNPYSSDPLDKVNIERKLSDLQNWIAQFNEGRNYFDNYLKRKILQAIIDEKKSNSLTELLELDRSKKKSLEEQTKILKDPELDRKLWWGDFHVRREKEKKEQDKKNRDIGKHFEQLFITILEENKIEYLPKDGQQDFIINPNSDNKFYVELKSISNQKDSVLLTPEQVDKAKEKKERYFLCVIPHAGDLFNFTKDDFIKNAFFNNSIYRLIDSKPENIKNFQEDKYGIKGVFPEEILRSFDEKPFKYKVHKNSWDDRQLDYFLMRIKLNL